MLARLVQFSLSQRLFILLATLIVAGAGWMAYLGLPIDAFPDVSSTQVKIIMKAPGMTPEEVESRIAVPIEVEMLGIPKTKILRSVTKYGLVDVTIDFEDGTDRLLGAPAGQRTPGRADGESADRHHGRHGADHDPARAKCLCLPSKARDCRWPNDAACSTGLSGRRCELCLAWPT